MKKTKQKIRIALSLAIVPLIVPPKQDDLPLPFDISLADDPPAELLPAANRGHVIAWGNSASSPFDRIAQFEGETTDS
jgi:hypothetical protein